MDPLLIFGLLAILLAVGLFFTLCGPVYLGLWMSLYLLYQDDPEKLARVHAIKFDSDRVLEQYGQLYSYWRANGDALDFTEFTLPLLVPPAFGALVSLVLTYLLARYVRSIFHV